MNTNYTLFSSFQLVREDQYYGLAYNVCLHLPPKVLSEGMYSRDFHTFQHSYTIFQLQIITIFIITQFFHFFLKRLGCPDFFASVMAGLVLGPTIKMEAVDKYKQMLFPFGSEDTLSVISSFGYLFYIFLSNVQMDFSMIIRTGVKVWTIAVSSLVVPIAIGFLSLFVFFPFFSEETFGKDPDGVGLPVIIIAHSGSSFPVIAALLNDVKILNSELGRLALASALVSGTVTSFLFSTATAIVSTLSNINQSYKNVAVLVTAYVLVPLLSRPAMMWVVEHTPEGTPVKKIYIYLVIVMVLSLGLLLNEYHQPIFGGAIIFGLCVPEGPPFGSHLVDTLELFSTWFLFPIFITTSTMKVDLTFCNEPMVIFIVASIILVVHLIKLFVCMGVCNLCKMPKTDGVCIGLILGAKGAVDIASYSLMYDAKKYDAQINGIMILSVLVIGGLTKLALKSLYDPERKYAGYQKRNIMNLKKNAELRIVACIHKPCHIIPIKNVLELCSPASNTPLIVDVLHLIELIGRSSPMFISHRHKKIASSALSNFSGELIVTFNLFEHDYAGFATINTYTAISPISFMQEAVCYLAMDKIASLIILPFHIKYSEDNGSVESEDNKIRQFNTKVMEKTPCSIGLLVNRGGSCSYNSTNIAMVFIGGADDREALCLAKRSVKENHNNLCVYRLVLKENDTSSWEYMLDAEVLKEIQVAYRDRVENVMYEEVIVEDATQTASFINDMANKFDYIIVGRRNGIKTPQTDALVSWTEYSELGVIGDLLASADLETKATILVVQQQQIHK